MRTVQRAVEERRREMTAAAVATVTNETVSGRQMQIDFGQKWVRIAGERVRVYLLVAVLSHSRRLFVKAFLSERQDDWREGIAAAFRHFGGVPRELLGDNAKAPVTEHNRAAQTVTFHPCYLAFCKDWDVVPRTTCGPLPGADQGQDRVGSEAREGKLLSLDTAERRLREKQSKRGRAAPLEWLKLYRGL